MGCLIAFIGLGLQFLDCFLVDAGCGVEVGGEFVDFPVLVDFLLAPGFFNDGVLGCGGLERFGSDCAVQRRACSVMVAGVAAILDPALSRSVRRCSCSFMKVNGSAAPMLVFPCTG